MGRPAAPSCPRRSVNIALAAAAAIVLIGGSARAQVPDATEPSTSARPAAQDQAAPAPAPTSGLSTIRFRGYSDVGFGRPLQEKLPHGGLQESKYSFQIADLHLFITSKLSDDWSFLSEALFTSDFTNESEAELDRLIVQYSPNNSMRLGIGKFNSGIGYYPNQFHRAKFYQVATGRPIMFSDEDNGGMLPVHQIGVTVQGAIPSGRLGLHYIGELANGRGYGAATAEIQNFADQNDFKAVTGGLFVTPAAAPALDAGFTLYHDTLEAADVPRVRETITAAHAVWTTPAFEFLNEVAVLKHTTESTGVTVTSKGFYSQVSQRFGVTRPYFRYDYQNVPASDPVFGLGDVVPPFGVRKAISAGLRFDIRQFAVVKVQYDHALQAGVWANGVHAQLALAF